MTGVAAPALDPVLNPKAVAVIGASPDMSRAGGRFLHHLRDYGYGGRLVAVNPRYDEIGSTPCFPSIEDVPDPVDLAVIGVSAPLVPDLVRACGRRGVRAVLAHADGFAQDPELGGQLRAAWQESGVRIIGPNTNGLRVAGSGMYADASTGLPLSAKVEPSPIAIITQSGGLGSYFGSIFLHQRGVGARYLIDTGNELDVDAAECLEYCADDPEVEAVGLIMESCRDGRRLTRAVEHATRAGVRVLILKLATVEASMAAAQSHAGAVAGRFDVFRELVEAAGARLCSGPRQFVDALAMCGRGIVPGGTGVGIVTGSGGFGVLGADLAGRYGLRLPQPTVAPTEAAREVLPLARFANPADLSAQGKQPAAALAHGVEFLASQPDLDSIVVMQPHSLLHPGLSEHIVAGLLAGAGKAEVPVFVCGTAGEQVREELWNGAGITVYESPDDLFAALGLLLSGPRGRSAGNDEVAADAAVADQQQPSTEPVEGGEMVVGEEARKMLAGLTELELVATAVVENIAAARRFGAEVGGPIMLKVMAPEFAHKTELGLVIGPVDGDDIETAFSTLEQRRDSLGVGYVTAEAFETGVEIAVGAFRDASFGPVLMIGAGGQLVELLDDVAFAAAPVAADEVARLLSGLRVGALLRGYRNTPAADQAALVRAIVEFSTLVSAEDFAFDQVDLNPVMVRESGRGGAVAVDYLLFRQPGAPANTTHPLYRTETDGTP